MSLTIMMTLTFLQKMMVIITVMRMMIYFLLLLLKNGVLHCHLLHLLVMHQMHQKILILILMRTYLKRQKRKLCEKSKRFSVNKILLNGEILTCQVLRDPLGIVSCLDLRLQGGLFLENSRNYLHLQNQINLPLVVTNRKDLQACNLVGQVVLDSHHPHVKAIYMDNRIL